jgi:predicted nucleic acid-binding protein
MGNRGVLYWDANVFISYLNGDMVENRISILEAIFEDIQKENSTKIVTSVLSKVEVSWVASEKFSRALSVAEEENIDNLWNDSSVLEIIELNDDVALHARTLLRNSMATGWQLKPLDAIHLATAQWIGATVVNTYDEKLFKFSSDIGISIEIPKAIQPKLPMISDTN